VDLGLWFAPPDSHEQGLQRQIGVGATLHGPPNNAPGKQIDHRAMGTPLVRATMARGQIQEPFVRADIGDVARHWARTNGAFNGSPQNWSGAWTSNSRFRVLSATTAGLPP
jgi:hypothetical protein